MPTELVEGNVRAVCPDCGAIANFEYKHGGSSEFGTVAIKKNHEFNGKNCEFTVYKLLRCASCGRGGMAVVHVIKNQSYASPHSELEDFLPRVTEQLPVPSDVPDGAQKEFREAERCASVGAWRAGSGLLRSTLEKALRASGYAKGHAGRPH